MHADSTGSEALTADAILVSLRRHCRRDALALPLPVDVAPPAVLAHRQRHPRHGKICITSSLVWRERSVDVPLLVRRPVVQLVRAVGVVRHALMQVTRLLVQTVAAGNGTVGDRDAIRRLRDCGGLAGCLCCSYSARSSAAVAKAAALSTSLLIGRFLWWQALSISVYTTCGPSRLS
eukprot:COSAG06_NODE_52_length_28059_cov_48.831378_5_plen_177_part_00